MARCGYKTLDGVRFFLPECIGGAVYGKRGCTCSTTTDTVDNLIKRMKALEKRVLTLESKNNETHA